MEKKNARTQTSATSALDKCDCIPSAPLFPELEPVVSARATKHETSARQGKFSGTDNQRQLRAIDALLRRSLPREQLDRAAGCSNGPDLIAGLRRLGLEVPCQRVSDIDRDGLPIQRGVYYITDQDRRKIKKWQGSRQKGTIDFTLAGLLAFAGVCAMLLHGVPA